MMLLDGRKVASEIKAELKHEVDLMKGRGVRPPHIAVVLVGNNPASESYVKAKIKACENIGFESSLLHFPTEISQEMLLNAIDELNESDDIDGFIVQLPLPDHIDDKTVIERVLPGKDIDGFHPINVGKMALGLDAFISATPGGILEMIDRYDIPTEGRHCVVLGRSNIVGGPMSILMRRNANPGNCTVTVAHSRTKNLPDICRQADILIAAIGKPEFVTADMVKPGAVVIDVGINRVSDSSRSRGYRLVGDVCFDEVSKVASAITPVPGGVGPMTIAYLLKNTMKAAKNNR
ncbi:MAG: bifunctional methylenetetrahydrofolate dehydrogenase/methenyltetrahydrofolate cyclohydrolase FolD [Salibacteraceae bacterium]